MTSDTVTADEAAIRALVDAFACAIRAKDIDGIMQVFAPEVVSFDLGPPLKHGRDDFERRWRALFDQHAGPVAYEVGDLVVTAGGDVAFSHSLNRNGDRWVRWTAGYRRIDGWWRIVHEHVSAPVDVREGRAVLDLKP